MAATSVPSPAAHTPEGGVLVGGEDVERRLVLYEDPQCPYCRQFEEVSGDVLRRIVDAGGLSVEYRMRCFLGPESVRADNALALAAEVGRFDQLRRELFRNQPPENSGGFTIEDLGELGQRAGITTPDYAAGLRERRYEAWVLQREQTFQAQDPQGTPAGSMNVKLIDSSVLFDPKVFEALLRP